ncbi:MAG: hypothetical protein M3Y72_22610, partial [Acidobacteriota bacterium]|nr:hypothetical protein [Acidobacteriota bacterium]
MFETYAERQKKLKGETPEVFTYDSISVVLRRQIVRIWTDAIGEPDSNGAYTVAYEFYRKMHKALAAEFGMPNLGDGRSNHYKSIVDFFCDKADTNQALDIIDFMFQMVVAVRNKPEWIHAY